MVNVLQETNVKSHSVLKVDLHKQMFTSFEMKTVCLSSVVKLFKSKHLKLFVSFLYVWIAYWQKVSAEALDTFGFNKTIVFSPFLSLFFYNDLES